MHMLKAIFTLLLFIFASCQAAAPVTHAYLAKKFFKAFPHYSPEEKNAFMVGTLFPDIRHIAENAREETHYENVSLNDILNESDPFIAGMKYHCFVDEQRENFVVENKMYDKTAEFSKDNYFTYLKLAEDEMLFDKYNWNDACLALQTLYPQELDWDISNAVVVKWHKLLTLVFVNSPSNLLSTFAMCKQGMMGISADEIEAWNKTLPQTVRTDWMQNYMTGLINHFDTLLQTP